METLKKKIIRALSTVTDAEALKKNEVIITTAFGLISGKVYNGDNSETEDIATKFVADLTNGIAEAYGQENIEGNDGYIFLKDVTIRAGGNNIFYVRNLVVFYDQIIGITFGSFN